LRTANVATAPPARPSTQDVILGRGAALGEYELVDQIGQGAMGTVYSAVHPVIEKKVAIKVLKNVVSWDIDSRKRFVLEARAANQIGHPNIVDIFAFGELADGRLYYVMELLSGVSLERHIELKKRLEEDEALWIAIQLCDALAAAHEVGIVHRDLKPDNIFLDRLGNQRRVKLLDFGVAKLVEKGRELLPIADGTPIGTPAYMSPEQCLGHEVDARSDIYAVGVLLFEALTGRLPFEGSTVAEIMTRHLEDTAPPLPTVSPDVANLVARCLEKDPAKRIQTAVELRELAAAIRRKLAPPSPERTTGRPVVERVSTWRRKGNLPTPQTSLVGRAPVVERVASRLSSTRLLTLTGPGGVGKTRVGIATAHALESKFAEGAHFVRLANIRDPALVTSAIAQVLGIRERPGKRLLESIAEQVDQAQALLVLDNFEQIVTAAFVIEALLQACANLQILVTSRFPLRIPGESELAIPPLELPARSSPEAIAANPAVQLFVDRVRAFDADFKLTPQNGPAIAAICRRVDGLPLAIELSAARVRVLSLDALLARLDDRLSVLTGGSSVQDPRHQTLRATIAWSYELLSDAERTLMRRLSVFTGGFSLESANVVAGWGALPEDVLDPLSSLVEKSLVARRVQGSGEPRFFTLETIREYAHEELVAAEELTATRSRHAAHFAALIARGELSFDEVEREHANIRAALDWVVRSGDATGALRLASLLWPFWERRGHLTEGRKHLEDVLAIAGSAEGAQREWLRVLHGAAVLADAQGDYATATRLFDRILEVHRVRGEPRGVAASLNNMAVSAERNGDLSRARNLYGESLRIFREVGAETAVIWSFYNLAQVALHQQDLAAATVYCSEGIAIADRLADRKASTWLRIKLANVRLALGEPDAAYELCGEALGHLEHLGDVWSVATALGDFGRICQACRKPDEAYSALAQSLTLHATLGDQAGVATTLETLARLAISERNAERALLLAGAAAGIRQTTGAAPARFEEAELRSELDQARAQLDGPTAHSAWQRGLDLSLEQAVALAVPQAPEDDKIIE
jgi:non-specific serine/threonine protein kinase